MKQAHTKEEITAARRRAVATHAAVQAHAKKMAPALVKQKALGECLLAGPRMCGELAVETGMTSDVVSTTLGRMETKLWVQTRGHHWSLTTLGRRELMEGKVYP